MIGDERLLLFRGKLDHAGFRTRMECRKYPIVDPEIGVAHVGALDHTVQGQCHAPEVGWFHPDPSA
jgi:hypothetical protein